MMSYATSKIRLRASKRATAESTKKSRMHDRGSRAFPAPEANAELQSNIEEQCSSTHDCEVLGVRRKDGLTLDSHELRLENAGSNVQNAHDVRNENYSSKMKNLSGKLGVHKVIIQDSEGCNRSLSRTRNLLLSLTLLLRSVLSTARDPSDLTTLATTSIVPVDLNVFLLKMELDIGFLSSVIGNNAVSESLPMELEIQEFGHIAFKPRSHSQSILGKCANKEFIKCADCRMSLLSVLTVECGHCSGLLSVNTLKPLSFNLLAAFNPNPEQVPQEAQGGAWQTMDKGSTTVAPSDHDLEVEKEEEIEDGDDNNDTCIFVHKLPDKKKCALSAYNRFIKEELTRLKGLQVQAGAGGIESMDWAAMVMQMYKSWAQQSGFQVTVIEEVPGGSATSNDDVQELSARSIYPFIHGGTVQFST